MRLLNDAEQKLIELGFKHAPIQCFDGETVVDKRYVLATDPPGRYYLLSIDCNLPGDQNVLQVMFWGVPTDVRGVALELGWNVFEASAMEVVGPNPQGLTMWQAQLRAPESMMKVRAA